MFFGPQGDTRWKQRRLETTLRSSTHHELDVRDHVGVTELTVPADRGLHDFATPISCDGGTLVLQIGPGEAGKSDWDWTVWSKVAVR